MSKSATQSFDVLLLAAGFGKRLRPLTETLPKALVPVGGIALLERHLQFLSRAGVRRVIINLHYLGDQIRDYVGNGAQWGLSVEYSEEPVILDTGGAIKQIEPLLEHQDLVTINADTLLDPSFPLDGLIDAHRRPAPQPLATLALRHDPASEQFGEVGVDAGGRICSFLGKQVGDTPPLDRLMYLGVQIISRKLLDEMPQAGTVFSITRDIYPPLLDKGVYLSSIVFDGIWSDVGTPERLEQAEELVKSVAFDND